MIKPVNNSLLILKHNDYYYINYSRTEPDYESIWREHYPDRLEPLDILCLDRNMKDCINK